MRCSRRIGNLYADRRFACWRNGRWFSSVRSTRAQRVSSTRQLILDSPSKRSAGSAINRIPRGKKREGRHWARHERNFQHVTINQKGRSPRLRWHTERDSSYHIKRALRLDWRVLVILWNGNWMILPVANVGGKWESISGSLSRS